MILDFTTTAVARPKIVNRTYASFYKNLKGVDFKKCTLYINIDPLPANVDRDRVVKVAEQYFGKVVANMPKKGNYTRAYNWVWGNAKTEYIFNLEDDWELTEEIHINELMKYFKVHPNLYEVALRAYGYEYRSCPTSPNIMHERYYKKVAGNLDESKNPECQLRGKFFGLEMPAPTFNISHKGKIICYPENRKRIVVKDLGREWIDNTNFKRPDKKSKFTTWVTK